MALEYYTPRTAGCSCIITQDVKSFYFSEPEVLAAEQFLKSTWHNYF